MAKHVEFIDEENCIKVDGSIYYGGTCEEVNIANDIVDWMKITSFGICKE